MTYKPDKKDIEIVCKVREDLTTARTLKKLVCSQLEQKRLLKIARERSIK